MLDLSDRLVSAADASIRRTHEGLRPAAHAMAGMAAEYGMAALEARLRTLMRAACQEPMGLSPCVEELAAELSAGCRGVARGLGTELV